MGVCDVRQASACFARSNLGVGLDDGTGSQSPGDLLLDVDGERNVAVGYNNGERNVAGSP